jgi:hypothetical protein
VPTRHEVTNAATTSGSFRNTDSRRDLDNGPNLPLIADELGASSIEAFG